MFLKNCEELTVAGESRRVTQGVKMRLKRQVSSQRPCPSSDVVFFVLKAVRRPVQGHTVVRYAAQAG